MEAISKDLNDLKDEISSSKEKLSKLQGREEELMKRLKSEFSLSSLSEAQKTIGKKATDLETLRTEIEKKYTDLKTQFEW